MSRPVKVFLLALAILAGGKLLSFGLARLDPSVAFNAMGVVLAILCAVLVVYWRAR